MFVEIKKKEEAVETLGTLSDDNRQSVDQQLRIPSFRYKIGTTEREKKRYAAP